MSAPLFSRLVPARANLPSDFAINLAELPPFLRVLLTTDGTVTKSLEAYFWEAIQVRVEQHELTTIDQDIAAIQREAGQSVLRRRIELVGEQSSTIYALADSFICEELLPLNIREDLREQRLGIGELLRECGLETYREVLEMGCKTRSGESWVWRTYRIAMDKQPLILITEQFPLTVFSK